MGFSYIPPLRLAYFDFCCWHGNTQLWWEVSKLWNSRAFERRAACQNHTHFARVAFHIVAFPYILERKGVGLSNSVLCVLCTFATQALIKIIAKKEREFNPLLIRRPAVRFLVRRPPGFHRVWGTSCLQTVAASHPQCRALTATAA